MNRSYFAHMQLILELIWLQIEDFRLRCLSSAEIRYHVQGLTGEGMPDSGGMTTQQQVEPRDVTVLYRKGEKEKENQR
jgi:hypothetical protein